MTRQQFLKTLLVAPLTAVSGMAVMVLPTSAKEKEIATENEDRDRAVGNDIILFETHVAGTAYYQADRVRHTLRYGQNLCLRRQPSNKYDELAIEVF